MHRNWLDTTQHTIYVRHCVEEHLLQYISLFDANSISRAVSSLSVPFAVTRCNGPYDISHVQGVLFCVEVHQEADKVNCHCLQNSPNLHMRKQVTHSSAAARSG